MLRTKYRDGDIVDDMLLLYRCDEKPKQARFMVRCLKCGREKSMLTQNLTKQHGTTHKACSQGYVKQYPKLYHTWNQLVDRTTNKNNPRYMDYGGRGLKHEFPLFIDFVDYMLPTYLEYVEKYNSYNITLDRIDNSKGYIKGNLRWATQREQSTNKRTTKHFKAYSPNGEIYMSKNAQVFSERFGLDRSGIHKVLNGKRPQYKGWRFEKTSEICVETIERVTK